MTCDIVQCLKTDVVRKQFIKNANRLNIVQKTLAAMLAEQLIKIFLACVSKRRVSHIVTERDSFNKINVKVKSRTYRSCNA